MLTVVTGFLFAIVTVTPALVVGGLTAFALVIPYTAIGRALEMVVRLERRLR